MCQFVTLASEFYAQDTQNLVARYDKCLSVDNSYVEKWTTVRRI